MKYLAIGFSVLVLCAYLMLMRVDPSFGFLHPRGGMAMLGISLAMACAAIWASGHSHRQLNTRFQLAAAGWIWIFVQAGAIVYIRTQAGGA